jgi:hypothetical protein
MLHAKSKTASTIGGLRSLRGGSETDGITDTIASLSPRATKDQERFADGVFSTAKLVMVLAGKAGPFNASLLLGLASDGAVEIVTGTLTGLMARWADQQAAKQTARSGKNTTGPI